MSRQATFFDPKGVPLILWGVPLLFLLASGHPSSPIGTGQERAVAGPRHPTANDDDRLVVMIQPVVQFDPKFKVPYLLGGLILGDSRAHVQEALKILALGRANHPGDWRFPFYTG